MHVSGHASQDDLDGCCLTRPRYFVPVHGEYRHLLGHARLAEQAGVPRDHVFLIEDGAGLEVDPGSARVLSGYPGRRVLVDGKGVGDVGAGRAARSPDPDRGRVIAVSLAVDAKGAVVAGPEIATRGVIYVKENEALVEAMRAR